MKNDKILSQRWVTHLWSGSLSNGYYPITLITEFASMQDADDLETALFADPNKKAQPPDDPMSADRVKWEHIHRVFELCNRNVSETARRLKMHRRTLQRILSKRSPK